MSDPATQLGRAAAIKASIASFVIAIIATCNRKLELAALLELIGDTPGVEAVVIADNAADPEIEELVRHARVCGYYLAMEANHGPAAALNRAIKFARQKWGESLTHYWLLDDDVRFAPDALEKLLAALAKNDAQLIAPVITEPSGAIFAWPELKSRAARQLFSARNRNDPVHFADGIDSENLPEFRACMATCYLMERVCYDRVGGIREDFWLLGEDVEYTARIAREFRGVFCPHVPVEHFWGAPLEPRNASRSAYFKACSALQNNLFMWLHLPHTRFVLRPFLGSLKRFLRLHLRSREAAYDFFWILWHASVRGEPAGARSGRLLRERRRAYEPG